MTFLTRSGVGVLVVALVLAVCGIWWGYEELVVAGVGAGVLLLVSLWSAQRPMRSTVTRRLASPRVARGDDVVAVYRVANDSRHRSGALVLIDTCADATVSVPVDDVAPGTAVDHRGRMPTRRRGVFTVGPLVVERVDAFGLAVGRRRTTDVASVIVHPRIHHLVGTRGAMRTVERESSVRRLATDPQSGFVSMREYVEGDDPRLIHWPTTARVGTLMVREHVEVRRPEFTVVLDTSDRVATPDDFEEAVDVAASVAVHALRSGLDVVVRTTSRAHAGTPAALTDEGHVLDLLTPVAQSAAHDLVSLPALFVGGPAERSAVVFVTGPAGPSSTLGPTARVQVVRVGAGAHTAPGVFLAVRDATEFARRWRSWD